MQCQTHLVCIGLKVHMDKLHLMCAAVADSCISKEIGNFIIFSLQQCAEVKVLIFKQLYLKLI